MLRPKEQQPSPPPQDLRPWYYQNWFLIPTFVLGWPITPVSIVWPLWAVLIIRSPWHNGIMSGALAWAMLLSGAFELVGLMRSDPATALRVLVPGVALMGTPRHGFGVLGCAAQANGGEVPGPAAGLLLLHPELSS